LKKNVNRLGYLALSIVGISLIIFSFFQNKIFYFNFTESIPTGLYRTVSFQTLKPGDFVAFTLPNESFVLMKEVVGVPGDKFCVSKQGRASVNENVFGFRLEKSSKGMNLPDWFGCEILSSNEFVVRGYGNRSFDSRYFGPIKGAKIISKIKRVQLGLLLQSLGVKTLRTLSVLKDKHENEME